MAIVKEIKNDFAAGKARTDVVLNSNTDEEATIRSVGLIYNQNRLNLEVLKQIYQLNSPARNDDTYEPETAADSDSTSEQESSDSEAEDETEPKSFLEGILTAARPWSTGGRWKKILKETSEEKVHKVVQGTRGLKNTVVGEPPPVRS